MEKPKQDQQTRPKKPYTSPLLLVHGSVEKITRGGNSGSNEPGGHPSDMSRKK